MRVGKLFTVIVFRKFSKYEFHILKRIAKIEKTNHQKCLFSDGFSNFIQFGLKRLRLLYILVSWIFWYPWHAWGRFNSGDIIVLILVFNKFLRQRHLVKFFILFQLKAVVTFIDATCIKRWQYHFSEPQWLNFLIFKFIPLLFWCLQQCSAVHFWKRELYLGWFWF